MKRINLKKLSVEFEIDKFQDMDLTSEIGNTLHKMSETVPISDLARRIYYSKGDIDIEDNLFSDMIKIITPRYKRIITDAILRQSEQFESQENINDVK